MIKAGSLLKQVMHSDETMATVKSSKPDQPKVNRKMQLHQHLGMGLVATQVATTHDGKCKLGCKFCCK